MSGEVELIGVVPTDDELDAESLAGLDRRSEPLSLGVGVEAVGKVGVDDDTLRTVCRLMS